jgi:hypothetical protein
VKWQFVTVVLEPIKSGVFDDPSRNRARTDAQALKIGT